MKKFSKRRSSSLASENQSSKSRPSRWRMALSAETNNEAICSNPSAEEEVTLLSTEGELRKHSEKHPDQQQPTTSVSIDNDSDVEEVEHKPQNLVQRRTSLKGTIVRMESIIQREGDKDKALLAISKKIEGKPEQVDLWVTSLLRGGADPNTKHKHTGQTPLHYIARCNNFENVALTLLEGGAAPDVLDCDQKSPLDVAFSSKNDRMTSLLIEHTESAEVEKRFTPDKFETVDSGVTKLQLHEMIDDGQMKRSVLAVLDCLVDENVLLGTEFRRFGVIDCVYTDEKTSHATGTDFTSAYQKFIDLGDKDYLGHRVVNALIEVKWRRIRKYYWLGLILSLMAAACLTAAAFLAMAVGDPANYDTSEVTEKVRIACEFFVCVWLLVKIVQEIIQFVRLGRKYWTRFWNYVDLAAIALLLSVIPLRALHKREQWAVYSAGYLLSIARLIKFFAIKWWLLTYVQIISKMWKEFVAFMLLCLLLFVSCIGSFVIAQNMEILPDRYRKMTEPARNASFRFTLLSASRTLLQDDPSANYYNHGDGYSIGFYPAVLILAFTFITVVILMNVLIAQLTDIYQEVKVKAETSSLANRGRIVAGFEQNYWIFLFLARACLPGKLFTKIFEKPKNRKKLVDAVTGEYPCFAWDERTGPLVEDGVERERDELKEKLAYIQSHIYEQSSLLAKLEAKLDKDTEIVCSKCRSNVSEDES